MPRYTEKTITRAVEKFFKKNGRPPRMNEMNGQHQLPTAATFKRLTGMTPGQFIKEKYPDAPNSSGISGKTVTAAYQAFLEENGRLPRVEELSKYHLPTLQTFKRLTGTTPGAYFKAQNKKAASSSAKNSGLLFQDLDRIVFAGDSITDMGSAQPVGEGLGDALGFGYVRMVENMLAAWYPQQRIRVTNAGVSGNTSRDLLARFQRDVIALDPQWVSICIGVNDVWRQFDCPAMPDAAVTPEEYRKNVEKMILEAAKTAAKGIILCTPYYMETSLDDPMRKRMDEYGEICRELAAAYNCIFVDFQAMYDRFFRHRHTSSIAWDGIHPNQIGAVLMAKELLSACGFAF